MTAPEHATRARRCPRPALSPRGLSLTLVALAGAAASAAGAQEPPPLARLGGPIELDGRIEDPAWQEVAPLPATMYEPTAGGEPSEITVFRVAYDDEYLYAAGELYDREPGEIRATTLKRDDTSFSNDWFAIGLDSFNDRENLLLFATNPAGVRSDGVIHDGQQVVGNFTWNTFWESAVARSGDGWSAEIRIPLSSLRFEARDGRAVMGVMLWRRIARRNEAIIFPEMPASVGTLFRASRTRQFVLEGLQRRNPAFTTPYLLAGVGSTQTLDSTGGRYRAEDHSVREVGLDLKYAVTSNLTVDLTYNTDFAQVEADDQQVNLTRFSLFFPEKRLFFQEREAVFEFRTGEFDRLFYSRRIGLYGNEQVPIHGGGRVVGRVAGWDVGALNLQTAGTDATRGENFGVARLRRQVFNENSYLGGIVTSRVGGVQRNLVYGVDATLRVHGSDYLLLNWAQSYDAGSGAGMLDRSLVRARLERRGVDGLTWALDGSRVGGEFNPALGFQLRTDYARIGDQVGYGWRHGSRSPLLRQSLTLKGHAYRDNADGSYESARLQPEWMLETKSGHQIFFWTAAIREELKAEFTLSETAVVPRGSYAFPAAAFAYNAPRGGRLRPNLTLEGGSFYDGWQITGRVAPTWNLSRFLELGGSYQYTRIGFPDRNQAVRAHIAAARGQVMLSTRLSAGAFVQYSSAADGVLGNLRIRYNPREGDDLYIVYNSGLNTDRFQYSPIRPFLDNHLLLVKYSRTFRLGG